MPLIKRKPVHLHPLPSLSTVLQPLPTAPQHLPSVQPLTDPSAPPSSSSSLPTPALDTQDQLAPPPQSWMPPDGKDDEEQLDRLLGVFSGGMGLTTTKGKRPGQTLVTGQISLVDPKAEGENGVENIAWRITDRECWYIPETGEIFTDYESYSARRAFFYQPLFQCEVSGKSSLSYFSALQSEQKEARQLHTRFPRQLKKAVLAAVQFQIEGKLESLADKIYERFANRFFDEVFVDVQGDKYLARIVKTFPPRTLSSSAAASPILSFAGPTQPPAPVSHPFATDLSLSTEELQERDNAMRYFYNVRLLKEGVTEGAAAENALTNGHAESEEKWGESVMEVQADKISRDRINFSRALLKRFIRDCVVRDAAVYSPWLVKRSVALRYGLPIEMSEEVREVNARYRERQMDKRKREREERMGLNIEGSELGVEGVEEEKPKTKKQKKEEEKRIKEEVQALEEDETKKKKPLKYPAEDLLVEYSEDRDAPAGRIEVRPSSNRNLPFGDVFERFLMSWSFLNVMGKPLGLSSFTIDDYEQSLYHNENWTPPPPLMVEIHATLLNALIRDLALGHEAARPVSNASVSGNDDIDYWEGKKGATTDTLRPVAGSMAEQWQSRELSIKDSRKGWEAALVGCLWERATLETLPNYLDNILHLTFEDKPAPTRPTWSTGPSQASGHGLVPTKPEKRYTSLHHLHKLDIITFLIELVSQTAAVRDFMEDSTAALTEVRKDQVEAKREWKRIQAEIHTLEPKVKPPEENGDGDASVDIKGERPASPELSIYGFANGTGTGTERDELEESPFDEDAHSSPPESDGRNHAAAARRQVMRERAAEREAEEAVKSAKATKDREDARLKKAEGKQQTAERRRLADEEESTASKLRSLEVDFRSHFYALRARPIGTDRFGNKVWWLDGCGSAPLVPEHGRVLWGTGRLYVQGADEGEVEWCRLPAEIAPEEVEARRATEEGESRLAPAEWASYDTPDQLQEFMSWLNPKGIREFHLLKQLRQWLPELEGGMHRRRIAAGLESQPDGEEPSRRARPVRKVAAGGGTVGDVEEGTGYMGWRNRRGMGKD